VICSDDVLLLFQNKKNMPHKTCRAPGKEFFDQVKDTDQYDAKVFCSDWRYRLGHDFIHKDEFFHLTRKGERAYFQSATHAIGWGMIEEFPKLLSKITPSTNLDSPEKIQDRTRAFANVLTAKQRGRWFALKPELEKQAFLSKFEHDAIGRTILLQTGNAQLWIQTYQPNMRYRLHVLEQVREILAKNNKDEDTDTDKAPIHTSDEE